MPVEVPHRALSDGPANELSTRITQIFNQKGPFRNVTEESLALDPDSSDSDAEEDALEEVKDSDEDVTEESIAKQRWELMEAIQQSNLQVKSALDFISMMLSQSSLIATSTFSPALAQAVKPGMFDSLVLPEGQLEANVQSLEEISVGWKATALNAAHKKLKEASERVRKEADREALFWSQVADLKENGWKITRHPSDKRVVGVHFGLPGSAPQFRSRGFAVLRQQLDAKVYLDLPTSAMKQRRVSVTIIRDNEVVGRHVPNVDFSDAAENISIQALNARNNLFDEELFHELGREARLAANQGIVSRAECFELNIDDHTKLTLSLTPVGAGIEESHTAEDHLAKFIGLAIRSLLLQAHNEARIRRSRATALNLARPLRKPEFAILRPLIALFRHVASTNEFNNWLEKAVLNPAKRAGLDVSVELQGSPHDSSNETSSTSDVLVSADPQIANYKLLLPSGKTGSVRITAYLGRPVYGCSFELSESDYSFTTLDLQSFDNLEDLYTSIERLLAIDIAALIINKYDAPEGKPNSHQPVVSDPRIGLLTLKPDAGKQATQTLQIKLGSNSITALLETGSPSKPRKRSVVSWTADGLRQSSDLKVKGATEGNTTLEQFVTSLIEEG